jgi:hypothetical protein
LAGKVNVDNTKKSRKPVYKSAYNFFMADTKRTKLEPNDQKLVAIPADPTHVPIAHVSTPLDRPKGKPKTERDKGKP